MTKNDCLQTRRAIFLMLSLVLLVAILPFASALKWNGVSALGNLTFDNTGTPLLNTGIGTFPTTNFGMVAGSYSCIDGNCLNASAGYGEITYNTLATDGTICMWSRFDKNTSLSGNQCIIVDDVGGANQGDFSLGFQGCNGYGSGGALTLEFNKAGGGVAQVSTPQTNFVKDNWYHICIRVASSRYGKIFINGSEVASLDAGGTTIGMFGTGAVGVFFGTTTEHLNATIDEFKYFNSALSDANILDMYQTELSSVAVTLNTPIDNDVVSSSSVNYNCSATTSGVLSNISLWTNSTGIWHRNQTIARTGTANETVFSSTISQTTLWNCEACNSGNTCSFASANYTLKFDNGIPVVSVTAPNGTINYGSVGGSLNLNFTATDSGLSKCWYSYGGVNTTVGCLSGVSNSTNNITLTTAKTLTIYANDTAGNVGSTTTSWGYKIFKNSQIFNSSVYETGTESYYINLTSNSSLSAVKLEYNSSEYSLTDNGNGIWSYSRDIPTTSVGTQSFNYKFTYAGDNFLSDNSTQTVNPLIFTLCNATYSTPFLNITFKNETNLVNILGTLSSATFKYFLGGGTQNKTYTFINNSENPSYAFCGNINRTFNTDSYVQFASTGYPQRIWNPTTTQYSNTTTNQALYLLGSLDGIYVTFAVINNAEQPLSGVFVNATREIGGDEIIIGTGTTGDDGSVTFWVNPNYAHTFSFEKSGYDTYTTTLVPTQSGYTINLGGATTTSPDNLYQGISISIEPTNTSLINNTDYSFRFILNSTYWDVDSFGFILYNSSGSVLGSNTQVTNGGIASSTINTGNNTLVYINYFWIINGNYTNGTSQVWYVTDTELSQFSIKYFFTDLKSYIGSGLFGLDNFGLSIFLFLAIFISTGIMSYKFGITSPAAISAFVFTLVLFLDVGLNMMENLNPVGAIPHFITVLTGIIMVGMVFREVYR